MARRNEVVPEDFLFHLLRTIKPLAKETYRHQVAIARMLWESVSSGRARSHARYAGYLSFTYKELDEAFGRRKFADVNARLRLFNETSWFYKDKLTKGYRLTAKAALAIERYMAREWANTTRLLYGHGKVLKTILPAIASKDMAGVTTRAWANATRLNKVPVDLEMLEKLRAWLKLKKKECKTVKYIGGLFFSGPVDPDLFDRLLNDTAQIIRMAKTSVTGYGYVMHHYMQASSGRLYARGVNLQNTPKLVRQAALNGLWDFDFANCHYSILNQMAARHGCQCEAIQEYLANKNVVRATIAKDAGISKDQAKVCLLAILYGARQIAWPENAIPKAIGIDAAERLFNIKLFGDIHRDIQKARNIILDSHKRTRKKSLVNLFGLPIDGQANKEKMLAHLIQGVEATALKSVLDAYPDDIILVQHDGFTATRLLDVRAIESAVLSATGYHLVLEVERIQLDIDACLARSKPLPAKSNIPKRYCQETASDQASHDTHAS